MRVRIVAEAEAEAREAARWYDQQEPGLGQEFLDELSRGLSAIESQPKSYPRIETLKSPREIRRCLLPRFPYLIVYEVQPDEAIVLAVGHARRRPNYWKTRG